VRGESLEVKGVGGMVGEKLTVKGTGEQAPWEFVRVDGDCKRKIEVGERGTSMRFKRSGSSIP